MTGRLGECISQLPSWNSEPSFPIPKPNSNLITLCTLPGFSMAYLNYPLWTLIIHITWICLVIHSLLCLFFWPTSRMWAPQGVVQLPFSSCPRRRKLCMHAFIHLFLKHFLSTHSMLGLNLGTRLTEMNKVWSLTLRALSPIRESAMWACNDHTVQ